MKPQVLVNAYGCSAIHSRSINDAALNFRACSTRNKNATSRNGRIMETSCEFSASRLHTSCSNLRRSPRMAFVYKVHRFPNDDPVLFAFLAGKLAALRLQALTLSPAAFGGQFVLEIFARMPYQLWIERLRRDNFHTFVAIAYPEGTSEEEQTVDRGDIVGTATLSKFAEITLFLDEEL